MSESYFQIVCNYASDSDNLHILCERKISVHKLNYDKIKNFPTDETKMAFVELSISHATPSRNGDLCGKFLRLLKSGLPSYRNNRYSIIGFSDRTITSGISDSKRLFSRSDVYGN